MLQLDMISQKILTLSERNAYYLLCNLLTSTGPGGGAEDAARTTRRRFMRASSASRLERLGCLLASQAVCQAFK